MLLSLNKRTLNSIDAILYLFYTSQACASVKSSLSLTQCYRAFYNIIIQQRNRRRYKNANVSAALLRSYTDKVHMRTKPSIPNLKQAIHKAYSGHDTVRKQHQSQSERLRLHTTLLRPVLVPHAPARP